MVISTRMIGQNAEVAVKDLGTGVSEENQPMLFSPFHTTKPEGMGMGLSICRSIMRDHGGDLNFANNEEGHGCTFYFRLPTGEEDE